MRERITINYVASGQPRPYADSRTITQVQFEKTPLNWSPAWPSEIKPEDIPWEPSYMNAEIAELWLRSRGIIGEKTPWKKDIVPGLDTHIVYIKPINPKKASEVLRFSSKDEEVSDVWEVYICQPFCD